MQSKEARLFEKRSKNFGPLAAALNRLHTPYTSAASPVEIS